MQKDSIAAPRGAVSTENVGYAVQRATAKEAAATLYGPLRQLATRFQTAIDADHSEGIPDPAGHLLDTVTESVCGQTPPLPCDGPHNTGEATAAIAGAVFGYELTEGMTSAQFDDWGARADVAFRIARLYLDADDGARYLLLSAAAAAIQWRAEQDPRNLSGVALDAARDISRMPADKQAEILLLARQSLTEEKTKGGRKS